MTSLLHRLSGAQRVWLLNITLGVVAASIFMIAAQPLDAPTTRFDLPWWVLAMAFALAEVFVVHIRFLRDAHSFSMSEVPLVIGLFFWSPAELVVAQLVGAGIALVLHRRQPPLKVAFNLAQWTFTTSAAAIIFSSIVRLGNPLGPAGWVAGFAATLLADFLAGVTINLAISLSEGTMPRFPHMGVGTAAVFANTCLGIVAVTTLWWEPSSAWLLIALVTIVFLAYQAYASVTRKHESLRLLYESTRAAQGSLEVESMLLGVLSHAREMFRAEVAEIDLFASEEEGHALRTTMSTDGNQVMQSVELDPRQGVWARVAAEGVAVKLARPIQNPRLSDHFGQRGIHDAIIAPIRGEVGVVGTILVGNRLGDFSTFDDDDLKVLETLANHTSVSLENGRLVDTLRQKAIENEYLAMHDALTGLPNRVLFQQRVRSAISAARVEDALAAVMLMDLDRFKEVNDTLGHHNGDHLLKEVGNRLRDVVRSSDGVARLGGDEFAILLPEIRNADAASQVAYKILIALERPFQLEEITLEIGASIGIAVFPFDGVDAETLLQRADVAMYVAKDSHTGYEIYSHEKDGYSADRLGLVAELRSAIDNDELILEYQPKVDLRRRRVTGYEALVRWDHPRRGFLPPDEFIPIAEQTGLIMSLTVLVLNKALRQCRRWAAAGSVRTVSVNLSARILLNAHLPDEVQRLLGRWQVAPELLVLEITESSLMADPERSAEILRRLSDMGIGLSIDDYGTGYSSLSHLRKLPVTEIKIDKSFVFEMTSDNSDAAIVRSTIELGHILGLSVVAEGVETRDVLQRLGTLGCDEAQGYFISKPIGEGAVPAWLDEYEAELSTPVPDRDPVVVQFPASGTE